MPPVQHGGVSSRPGAGRPLYPVGKRPPTHSGSKALNGAAIILFLIPLVVCLFADMSANHRLDWFGYVAGALAVSYVAVALPLWFKRPNPVIYSLAFRTPQGSVIRLRM